MEDGQKKSPYTGNRWKTPIQTWIDRIISQPSRTALILDSQRTGPFFFSGIDMEKIIDEEQHSQPHMISHEMACI